MRLPFIHILFNLIDAPSIYPYFILFYFILFMRLPFIHILFYFI